MLWRRRQARAAQLDAGVPVSARQVTPGVEPGCVVPSIVTGPVIWGRPVVGAMVTTPPMPKAIVSLPARLFASWIAARSVHCPPAVAQTPLPGEASTPSAVEFTVSVTPAAESGRAMRGTEKHTRHQTDEQRRR